MKQGTARGHPDYLFTDADIAHQPDICAACRAARKAASSC